VTRRRQRGDLHLTEKGSPLNSSRQGWRWKLRGPNPEEYASPYRRVWRRKMSRPKPEDHASGE